MSSYRKRRSSFSGFASLTTIYGPSQILFPKGDGHMMGSEPGRRSEPDYSLYYRPDDRVLPFVLREMGGDGEKARFVCGYLGCDARPFNPILSALPRMINVAGNSFMTSTKTISNAVSRLGVRMGR